MGKVHFTIVPFSYAWYCCGLLQYTDGSKDIIGCYTFEGIGAFYTVENVCRNSGGYFVDVGNATENQAVAGKITRAPFTNMVQL